MGAKKVFSKHHSTNANPLTHASEALFLAIDHPVGVGNGAAILRGILCWSIRVSDGLETECQISEQFNLI